jgi:hypothetical protein
MARFNTTQTRPQVFSPITGEQTASGTTYQGAPGYARDTKSELFLYAVSRFTGEGSFYEDAKTGDTRYRALVCKATEADPQWVADFLRWLRADANMRSAAIVGACEYVKTRLLSDPTNKAKAPTGRKVIDSVQLRADEPGEVIAYWTSTYGFPIPKPIKRGVADAMLRLGSEYNYLKYGESGGFTWDRLLNLCHPGDLAGARQRIRGEWQHALFGHIIKRKYEPGTEIPEALTTLTRRQALMKLPVDERRAALDPIRLKDAGMTWEALAGWLQGPMDAQAWEAIIPNMGLMALTRNLRNFDQQGVADQVAAQIMAKLADPEQVAKSRQLPMRFLSAYRNVPSDRWKWPLTQAVNASLANIPQLGGRTLILADMSSSMDALMSDKSGLKRWDAAALFGCALASRCADAELVAFSSSRHYYHDNEGAYQRTKVFNLRKGESLLAMVDRWGQDGYFLGGGTETEASLRQHYGNHDRVVILTDEQASGHQQVGSAIPNIPIFTWNLAGYQKGYAPSGSDKRHVFGGLNDAAFKMVPMIESGVNGQWPWAQAA